MIMKEKDENLREDQNDSRSQQPYNSEVTKEDLEALGAKGLRRDDGDDKMLNTREQPIDFAGKNLDIPGRDTINNATKNLNDEENTLYGQGSESKKGLESPKRANTTNNQ